MLSEESAGGTFLEDFLSSLEFVPIDVRGNFELVRVLFQSPLLFNTLEWLDSGFIIIS